MVSSDISAAPEVIKKLPLLILQYIFAPKATMTINITTKETKMTLQSRRGFISSALDGFPAPPIKLPARFFNLKFFNIRLCGYAINRLLTAFWTDFLILTR